MGQQGVEWRLRLLHVTYGQLLRCAGAQGHEQAPHACVDHGLLFPSLVLLVTFLHCRCYTYRVTVFCPWTQRVERVEVTDPYSRCTTANGERTIIMDVNDATLLPSGWLKHDTPALQHWTDISVYELHIRDFR